MKELLILGYGIMLGAFTSVTIWTTLISLLVLTSAALVLKGCVELNEYVNKINEVQK